MSLKELPINVTDASDHAVVRVPEFVVELIRDWIDREMSAISEDHYAAGWMCDLSHSLWLAVASLPRDYSYGMGAIGIERLSRLKQASEIIGEWNNGGEPVTVTEWLSEFDATKASGKAI